MHHVDKFHYRLSIKCVIKCLLLVARLRDAFATCARQEMSQCSTILWLSGAGGMAERQL